jgi:hypothetical protein
MTGSYSTASAAGLLVVAATSLESTAVIGGPTLRVQHGS